MDIPRLLADFHLFMVQANEAEQGFVMRREFPGLEKHWTFRLGTSSVDAICDLHQ